MGEQKFFKWSTSNDQDGRHAHICEILKRSSENTDDLET